MQKGFTPIFILIGIVVLALISGAYYLGSQNNDTTQISDLQNNSKSPNPTSSSQVDLTPLPKSSSSTSPKSTADPSLANWQLYTDSKAGFSIKYPPYMRVNQQYSNPGSGLTLIPEEGWKCTIQTGEPCLSSFNVIVYPGYDGSSRREWFDKDNLDLIPERQTYDLMVDGVNALVMQSTTQGQTLGAVGLIPKGSKMYTVYFYFTLGLPPLEDRQVIVNRVLSTFKFN
jgi:hypothetical protein